MILQCLNEFISTFIFALVIISTSNVVFIGIVFTILKLINNDLILNPAITILLYYNHKIDLIEIIPYCLAQILAAVIALLVYNEFLVKNML